MDLWDDDEPIADRFEGVDVPEWIEPDISPYDVAAIVQAGCASGAYMPAVTYHTAERTMAEHGDAVCEYLGDSDMSLHFNPSSESWAMFCTQVLSAAVELWAMHAESALSEVDDD